MPLPPLERLEINKRIALHAAAQYNILFNQGKINNAKLVTFVIIQLQHFIYCIEHAKIPPPLNQVAYPRLPFNNILLIVARLHDIDSQVIKYN